ncbi:hypothetical protein vBCbaSRXM_78 [Citromicrobium phage vB_CbaS-RXM]|nr:hypothetical protein vBCbaSRXM_78 [Citromicrobium phage vB_CbaS-RXM]
MTGKVTLAEVEELQALEAIERPTLLELCRANDIRDRCLLYGQEGIEPQPFHGLVTFFSSLDLPDEMPNEVTQIVFGRTEPHPMPYQIPKETNMPIYDDPNHPHYGPVRRLHLILLYLFGDRIAEAEKRHIKKTGVDWTYQMSHEIEKRGARGERIAAMGIIRIMQEPG